MIFLKKLIKIEDKTFIFYLVFLVFLSIKKLFHFSYDIKLTIDMIYVEKLTKCLKYMFKIQKIKKYFYSFNIINIHSLIIIL